MEHKGWTIELRDGRIRRETTIVRTLGVTENTYEKIALIGAVLASGLGSGWRIQFAAWVIGRARDTSTTQPHS